MNENREIEALKMQLVELQSQLAFQEDTIGALDAVVTRQQQQIVNLQEMWKDQKSQLDHMRGQLEDKPSGEERPPHY